MTILFHFLLDSPAINEVASRPPLCKLKPESGPCKAAFPAFYFDSSTNTCNKFIYGGCGGNGNKFSSISECEKECKGRVTCFIAFSLYKGLKQKELHFDVNLCLFVSENTQTPVRICCQAGTAECLSCAEGMEIEEYCKQYPITPGCKGGEHIYICI